MNQLIPRLPWPGLLKGACSLSLIIVALTSSLTLHHQTGKRVYFPIILRGHLGLNYLLLLQGHQIWLHNGSIISSIWRKSMQEKCNHTWNRVTLLILRVTPSPLWLLLPVIFTRLPDNVKLGQFPLHHPGQNLQFGFLCHKRRGSSLL